MRRSHKFDVNGGVAFPVKWDGVKLFLFWIENSGTLPRLPTKIRLIRLASTLGLRL